MLSTLVASLLLFQAVTIGPTDAIGFDYATAEMTTYAVSRFEVSWDNSAYASLGIPATVAGAPAGFSTYKVIPPFTSGQHTVVFRACNALGCGGSSTPFRLRVSKRP
jgi:hypothetical protein